ATMLKSDGTVVRYYGGTVTETIPGISNVVDIAEGWGVGLALKSDGTVVYYQYGQPNIPSGLSGISEVSASSTYSVALEADGTVQATGFTQNGGTFELPA